MTSPEQIYEWLPAGFTLEDWHSTAHRQLDHAFHLSPNLSFDNTSGLVFFSDLHRGTGDFYDVFAPNADLFHHALDAYFQQEYTYIEVGDGDELWHNHHFQDVRRAYTKIFDLLHQFHRHRRLHLLVGNHDSQAGLFDPMEKAGIPVHQGLVLTHTPTGKKIFAVHGHHADPAGDQSWSSYRWQSRHFWKYIRRLGTNRFHHFVEPQPGLPEPARLSWLPQQVSDKIMGKAHRMEEALRLWLAKEKMLMICGHTHMFHFPKPGDLPFFNIGHGTSPGYITGLEIDQGEIRFVKWTRQRRRYQRHLLQTRPLTNFTF